jgi:hypothetical protein
VDPNRVVARPDHRRAVATFLASKCPAAFRYARDTLFRTQYSAASFESLRTSGGGRVEPQLQLISQPTRVHPELVKG